MSRRIWCPIPKFREAWVELPDEWLGYHAQRREAAIESARSYKSETLTQFAIALAVAENWNIPGLAGSPDKWDFTKLDLRLLSWVKQEVLSSYNLCFFVPKGLSEPLPNGSATGEATEAKSMAGDSEPTA